MEKLQNQFEKNLVHNCVDIKISIFFYCCQNLILFLILHLKLKMMMMKLFPRTQIDQILQELTQRDTKINLVDYFYQNTKEKRC